MTTVEKVTAELEHLPETLATEVLDFVRFLRWRHESQENNVSAERAIGLLDNPTLDLNGRYLSRDECHVLGQQLAQEFQLRQHQ